MSDQNIISLGFDPEKFDASKNHILEGLQQVKQIALELPAQFKATFDSIASQSGSTIKAGSTGGFTELKSKIGELQTTTEIYNKAVQVTTDRMALMNGQSKEYSVVLLNEVKAVKEAAAAKLNDAKATTETTKAKILETKETERSATAKAKEAQKTKELSEPYKQLVIQFAAAAREAKNLAAQYGTTDKRAQDAAKAALALNNQLKTIDSSIGNHQREVGNYGKAWDGVGDKLKNFGSQLLSLVGIFSVASFFKDSVDAFLELDKATRLLQNTLRNIGAPELFGRIEEGTRKLTKQFKFLREEDIQTVFNKLIVYGKLTENQINDLLPVIINFATATGKDLPEASALILKAMEGNGRALKEFGINMKDAKTPAEGLSLIMKELKPRVEGVATAFGESAAGQIAIAREEFRKTKEEVGSGLIPVLTKLLSFLSNALNSLKTFTSAIYNEFSNGTGNATIVLARLNNVESQKEIETSVAQKLSTLDFQLKTLKELQKQGKLAGVTEQDIRDEFNTSIKKLITDYQVMVDQKSKSLNILSKSQKDDFLSNVIELNALKQVLEKTQNDTNKDKILHPPGTGGGGGGTSNKKDTTEEDNAKARFEIFKLEAERRADLDMEIVKNEKLSYTERLGALNDYANTKHSIIEETARFELTDSKLTAEQIRLVEAKRIDSSLRLSHTLSDAIKETAKDFKGAGKAIDIEVKGMTKSMAHAIDEIQKKLNELKKKLEDAQKEEHDLKKQLGDEILNFTKANIDAAYEHEKNRIQSLIDKNNEYAQAETDRITNSTLSEQDKAAKLIQLQATTDAKNKEYARKQKEEDIKKAKFDKAFSIAKIVEETAVAIIKVLADYPGPPGFALAALTGAIGAVQLATALAQPIPTYAEGTQDHPGGPARYGEAGPEAVVLPDGKTFIANKDTVSDLPAHAKVIPLSRDYVNEVMYSSMMRKTSERLAMAEVIEMRSESRTLDTDRIVAAIEKSNKKVINRVSVTNDFGWIEYINKNIYGKG